MGDGWWNIFAFGFVCGGCTQFRKVDISWRFHQFRNSWGRQHSRHVLFQFWLSKIKSRRLNKWHIWKLPGLLLGWCGSRTRTARPVRQVGSAIILMHWGLGGGGVRGGAP